METKPLGNNIIFGYNYTPYSCPVCHHESHQWHHKQKINGIDTQCIKLIVSYLTTNHATSFFCDWHCDIHVVIMLWLSSQPHQNDEIWYDSTVYKVHTCKSAHMHDVLLCVYSGIWCTHMMYKINNVLFTVIGMCLFRNLANVSYT